MLFLDPSLPDSSTIDGVIERRFESGGVPGILWAPPDRDRSQPLVLVAHGGGRSKSAEPVVKAAHRYVLNEHFAVAALDAPGHGERPPSADVARFGVELRSRFADGQPVGAFVAEFNAGMAARAVPEWRALLDDLTGDVIGAGTAVGFHGVSMGSGTGIPLVAAEPRITAAVLGLAGSAVLEASASRIRIPVRFLMQWDDELVPRAAALALYGAIGSAAKSLHANPGTHAAVPRFEYDDAERFLAQQLGG